MSEAQREAKRKWAAQQSSANREIGPIRPIADPKRRARCRKSLRKFCETYNPSAFNLQWSDAHLKAIARIEEAAVHGAMFAFAMPRGSGKSTICRMAALWVMLYAYRQYVFVVGATQGKGEESIATVDTFIRFLPRIAEDFPEVAQPANAIGGITNRARGQLCQGRETRIQWAKERLVFPTVPPPPNMTGHHTAAKFRKGDAMAPTCGHLIAASGLTSEGIRGSLQVLSTGELIRPDLVLLDDPQTDESANSPKGNETRLRLINGAVLGMAGPGKHLSAVMPCTVIAKGDMIDQVLDRSRHPLWRGERTKMLESMPKHMDRWQPYFNLYYEDAQREPPNYEMCNAYYLEHRDELDEGARASWPDNYESHENSAIQHAMNLFARDEPAFYAEYQNEPLNFTADSEMLSADQIAAKVTSEERLVVPPGCHTVTAFIDCQARLLYWSLMAWGDSLTGAVIGYGAWPEQPSNYFAYRDAHPTLETQHEDADAGGAIYAGLLGLINHLVGRSYRGADGGQYRVRQLLVDAGYQPGERVVYRACRDTTHAAVVQPARGYGITASARPMSEWKKERGDVLGPHWRQRTRSQDGVREVTADTNYWKTAFHQGLARPIGEPGAITLYKDRPRQHRMFADHVTIEKPIETQGRGRELTEWKAPPGVDNHLFDCVVGCMVAASMLGVSSTSHEKPKQKSAKRRRSTGAWAKLGDTWMSRKTRRR